MDREHPLAGFPSPRDMPLTRPIDLPRLSPEQIDAAIRRARELYAAMTPADFRRMRREERGERVRAFVRRFLRI